MDNKNSTKSGHTSSKDTPGEASAVPKGAMPRSRVNIQRVQNVLLIWLDNNIENNNEDYCNSVSQLCRVVDDIQKFTDVAQCIDFLTDNDIGKVIMIISRALCQETMPLIHDIVQLHTIFVICSNNNTDEQWANEWPKIRGVFTDISPICEALKHAAQSYEHDAISISFVATNTGDASSETLHRLDPSFMYTQILKEIFLTIEFGEQHIQQFIDYCREQFADNDLELSNIRQLETKYRTETPIWWYTCQCFLCPLLNLGLRVMDANIIARMVFFIVDLHRHIEKLHSEQFIDRHTGQKFTVYRGQGLSKEDFEKMMKTKVD
jgi:hypothetical protein